MYLSYAHACPSSTSVALTSVDPDRTSATSRPKRSPPAPSPRRARRRPAGTVRRAPRCRRAGRVPARRRRPAARDGSRERGTGSRARRRRRADGGDDPDHPFVHELPIQRVPGVRAAGRTAGSGSAEAGGNAIPCGRSDTSAGPIGAADRRCGQGVFSPVRLPFISDPAREGTLLLRARYGAGMRLLLAFRPVRRTACRAFGRHGGRF